LNPLGVPKALQGTAIPFKYNDIDEFMKRILENKGKVSAVIVETIRNIYPDDEFFNIIRDTCYKEGIVLIFDEITSGFRINTAGAHMEYGYEPDIAVFAKAMTNGYPMAAIIGKKDVMNVAQDTFVSSLYWTDKIGPAATLATIKKIIKNDVPAYTKKLGLRTQNIWKSAAEETGLKIKITGPVPQLSIFAFDYPNYLEIKTVFNQEMLKRGFLTTTAFYPTLAHEGTHLDKYEHAVNEVFNIIKDALEKNKLGLILQGPICHDGFKRLT